MLTTGVVWICGAEREREELFGSKGESSVESIDCTEQVPWSWQPGQVAQPIRLVLWVVWPGDHYIRYNSDQPTIIAVSYDQAAGMCKYRRHWWKGAIPISPETGREQNTQRSDRGCHLISGFTHIAHSRDNNSGIDMLVFLPEMALPTPPAMLTNPTIVLSLCACDPSYTSVILLLDGSTGPDMIDTCV
ncbi:hypothetical protein NA57DRAFT_54424 [Rhizodiscina lignyota]|uniref:Uncharacterized protein n=1 Tax=Rhizodiscina lignyota TaxID=1504668 RepID=A0A9P4MAF9_9PEZI|nr:hypothetical protein NA57DRAFT_54424 [Rhizodiscina lignyota]